MTKRKLSPQQQVRKLIDKRVDDVIERAEEMIRNDVPVVLAFRLSIAWELEVSYYAGVALTMPHDN